MSRRNPNADKAAANQAVIKQLLKLPGNKVCADCKRNKLPRWASWNLGVFICIRCSGIHRGLGTHISRVKSVDLDTWTDEQLQSVVKWGNTRANKYWEAKLTPGHVPSEGKMENFVRTKYELKRWVMDGPMPDPATLDDDEEDDNVPLTVVQQKLQNNQASAAKSPPPAAVQQPKPPAKEPNLFDDFDAPSAPPAKAPAPAPKSTNDMLGDFFAAPANPEPRSSSAASQGKMTSSRPDLNRSILSLYAAAPKPQVQSPMYQQQGYGGYGQNVAYGQQQGFQAQHTRQSSSGNFGGLTDAFGGLSFGGASNTPPPPPAKPSAFANLTSGLMKSGATPQVTASSSGGFFSQTPKPSAASAAAHAATTSNASAMGDLFDLASPAPQPKPAASTANSALSGLTLDNDVWSTPATTTTGTSNAWASSTTPAPPSSASAWGATLTASAGASSKNAFEDDGWGDFSSSTGATTAAPAVPSKSGLDDDVFGNVWK